ncbi:hypothetical protein JCM24511_02862 [Saitozyma sp. JCM 24511]|nr:hypothetical protein JCM24511_02862 [Saitozyma sp. JCM 24511]
MSHAHPPHSLPSTSTSAFTLVLGAIGKGRTCPHDLRCPPHIQIPFSATYYDLEHASARGTSTASPGRGAAQTPWTATIDLESHYFDAYATSPVTTTSASTFQPGSSFPPSGGPAGTGGPEGLGGHGRHGGHGVSVTPDRPAPPPPHPGYRVAPVGQLQLLVKSPSSAVKVFLVPYDLRDLAVGGRLLARERTWVETAPTPTPTPTEATSTAPSALNTSTGLAASISPPLTPSSTPISRRESLRYAVQLQFICVESDEPPSSSASAPMRESATTRHRAVSASLPRTSPHPKHSVSEGQTDGPTPTRKAYYVSKSIKVIFASNPPEKDEITRTERADELVPPSTPHHPAAVRPSEGTTKRLVKGSSPSSVGRAGEWDLLRKKWEARQQVQATLGSSGTIHPAPTSGTHPTEAATPTPTPIPTSTANSTSTPTPTSTANSAAASPTPSPAPPPGLGYSFNRLPIPPVSPVSSPLSAPIPLPLLSPAAKFAQGLTLPTIESRDTSRSSSPGPSSNGVVTGSSAGTNGSNGFPTRTASPQPPSIRVPVAQRYTRTKLRRGSGSIEERELSEKLRAMRMSTAEQEQEQERGASGAPGAPGAPGTPE